MEIILFFFLKNRSSSLVYTKGLDFEVKKDSPRHFQVRLFLFILYLWCVRDEK